MPNPIENWSLEALKAKIYDLAVERDNATKAIELINQEIAKRVTPEPTPSAPTPSAPDDTTSPPA